MARLAAASPPNALSMPAYSSPSVVCPQLKLALEFQSGLHGSATYHGLEARDIPITQYHNLYRFLMDRMPNSLFILVRGSGLTTSPAEA